MDIHDTLKKRSFCIATKMSRLSVKIPPRDHRKLKVLAGTLGVSLRDLVLGALEPLVHLKIDSKNTNY